MSAPTASERILSRETVSRFLTRHFENDDKDSIVYVDGLEALLAAVRDDRKSPSDRAHVYAASSTRFAILVSGHKCVSVYNPGGLIAVYTQASFAFPDTLDEIRLCISRRPVGLAGRHQPAP